MGEILGIPQWEVSDRLIEHGIKKNVAMDRPGVPLKPVHTPDPVKGPYLRWDDRAGSGETLYVSQLMAIAKGADPHEVFSQRVHARFKNGRRDDLRLENIEITRMKGQPWQDKETLKEALKGVQRLDEVCEKWDISKPTVQKWMKEHNLARHYDTENHEWYVVEEPRGEDAAEVPA